MFFGSTPHTEAFKITSCKPEKVSAMMNRDFHLTRLFYCLTQELTALSCQPGITIIPVALKIIRNGENA